MQAPVAISTAQVRVDGDLLLLLPQQAAIHGGAGQLAVRLGRYRRNG